MILTRCEKVSRSGKVCWFVLNHPGRVHVDISDGGMVVWSEPDEAPFTNKLQVPADPLQDAPEALRKELQRLVPCQQCGRRGYPPEVAAEMTANWEPVLCPECDDAQRKWSKRMPERGQCDSWYLGDQCLLDVGHGNSHGGKKYTWPVV